MPSRWVFVLIVGLTLCLGDATDAFAGRLFRQRSQSYQPSNTRPGLSRRDTRRQQQEDTAEDEQKQPSVFDGVDAPPSLPRAAEAARLRGGYGAVSARPNDTLRLVNDAIDRTKKRYLTAGQHTPWQIFHGVLALRHEFQLRDGNHMTRGLDWLRDGVSHNGQSLVEKTPHGARFHPFTIPWAFEGHVNQFLAILSVSSLPEDYQFRTARGEIVTMGDMVRHAQLSMDGRGEMTWTLWFLTHYVEPDAEWETAAGQFWSMERLVRMEARHKVNGAPCGGSHRLFALSLARNSYLAKHGQIRGAWLEADQKIREYIAAAKSLQNRDGSFSADWFKGRKYSSDLTTRLKTSGHVLEWLMVALPDNMLKERWVQMAVQSVARDVIRSANEPSECGALYHALDALTFYKLRVDPPQTTPAKSPTLLVPESTPSPSTPPEILATNPDVNPKPIASSATPNEPKAFVAPKTAQPLTSSTPRVAVEPGPVRPLAAKQPTPAVKAGPSSEKKTDKVAKAEPQVQVEQLDVAPQAQVAVKPKSVEPKPTPAAETPEKAELAATDPEPAKSDAEEPTTVAESTPTTEDANTSSVDEQPIEPSVAVDLPAPIAIPEDAVPLITIIPDQPDSESAPNTVDQETPADIEPTNVSPAIDDEEIAEGPTENTTAQADPQPKAAEDQAAVQTAEVPQTPELPNVLPAPKRPESEPEQTAEQPTEDRQAMTARPSVHTGLVVIQLDDIENRPIEVPMVGQSPIRRTAHGWRSKAK